MLLFKFHVITELQQIIEISKQTESDDKNKIKKLERVIKTYEIEKDQLFKVSFYKLSS